MFKLFIFILMSLSSPTSYAQESESDSAINIVAVVPTSAFKFESNNMFGGSLGDPNQTCSLDSQEHVLGLETSENKKNLVVFRGGFGTILEGETCSIPTILTDESTRMYHQITAADLNPF